MVWWSLVIQALVRYLLNKAGAVACVQGDFSTKTTMIKACIFDFGGVLVITEDYRPRHAWDERLGLPVGSVERVVHYSDLWIQAQLGRISYDDYWKGVAERLYMRQEDIDALRRDYFSGDRLNHRLVNVIKELREQGMITAILSNETAELLERLQVLGLRDLFDQVFISAQLGVMKPDPAAYRLALQALQVAPQETIFLDDALRNVRAAQQLGLHAQLFRPALNIRVEFHKTIQQAAVTD